MQTMPTLFVDHVSAQDIEQGRHLGLYGRTMLIQIMDPGVAFPKPKYRFDQVHQFGAWDQDHLLHMLQEYVGDCVSSQEESSKIHALIRHAFLSHISTLVDQVLQYKRVSHLGAQEQEGKDLLDAGAMKQWLNHCYALEPLLVATGKKVDTLIFQQWMDVLTMGKDSPRGDQGTDDKKPFLHLNPEYEHLKDSIQPHEHYLMRVLDQTCQLLNAYGVWDDVIEQLDNSQGIGAAWNEGTWKKWYQDQGAFAASEALRACIGSFGLTQAHMCALLIEQSLEKHMHILVHCHAGISRSSAVASCAQGVGFSLEEKTRTPNLWIKKVLAHRLGIPMDWSERYNAQAWRSMHF